jgi:hypothetical protein
MTQTILQPVVALVLWTFVIWLWMYATRIPAMRRDPALGIMQRVGGKGTDLDGVLPIRIQWIAHNHNHLFEAPTLFYAVALMLALVGQGHGFNTTLAWGYVGLRVAHSLVQILWNRIIARFALYALSSVALFMLATHAALAVFGF